jgi:uncharacterized protein (TIGR00661 family)
MKILYGIQLTGNGHITRSIQIIKSLKESGCEVDIITSGNNSQLELPYEVKNHYRGLSFFYNRSGGIDWIKTIKSLDLPQFLKDIEYDVRKYDIVVSDFEPISAWSAQKYKIPSIGIGNQYSFLSKDTPRPKSPNKISEMFLKRFAKCDHNIALNYQKYDDSMSLPIISEALLGKETKEEDFYLVYLPSLATDYVLEQLKDFNCYDWKIYSPDVKEDYTEDRIQMKKLNKEGFTEDLLNCKGVITASGFSTTTEALVLNKKIWSIPIKGQYEQLCNAIALKRMGIFTEDLNKDTISKWITGYKKIDYDWNNPIDEIVKKIISHNGKN